eukprot:619087-Pelagomonas_calceolata.AAC.1
MQLIHGLVLPAQALTMHRKSTENASLEKSSQRSLGCPPGSRRKPKRPDLNSNSACLNLKPGRASLTFPEPQHNSTLSNLERQGFEKPDVFNIWKQKLDTELRNKIAFDMHPTNPQ